MDKNELEQSLRKGGTVPILRERMGDYDLFFSDGFSHPPHLSYQKFGIEPEEFPGGMFVTVWWLGRDEKLHIGRPLFFDMTEPSKDARINAARQDAARAFKKLRKH